MKYLKLQIPNPKSQINPKHQYLMSVQRGVIPAKAGIQFFQDLLDAGSSPA